MDTDPAFSSPHPSPASRPPIFSPPTLAWFCWLLFAAAGVAYVLADRCFFADGTGFFLRLLQDRQVFNPVKYRWVSNAAQQIAVERAVNLFGCRDLRTLTTIWGLNLYYLPIVGLGLSWIAVRRWNPTYFVFPLVCHAILFMDVGFCLFHESWTMTALFWGVLLRLLSPYPMTFWWMAGLVTCALLGTQTYESYMFLAFPLLAAVALRLRRTWRNGNLWEPVTGGAAILVILYGLGSAVQEALHPFDPGNRESFQKAVFEHLRSLPVRFSLLSLLVLAGLLVFPRHRRIGLAALGACGVFGAFVILIPWNRPWNIDPMSQYVARIQTIYVPLGLGLAAVWLARGPLDRLDSGGPIAARLWGLAVLCTVVSVGFQLGCTARWSDYLAAFRRDLKERQGLIPFDESAVGREPIPGEPDFRPFTWSWTMPQLSVFLSALDGHPVRALVRTQIPGGWEIFDPQKSGDYPDLTAYGVTYDFPALLPEPNGSDAGATKDEARSQSAEAR